MAERTGVTVRWEPEVYEKIVALTKKTRMERSFGEMANEVAMEGLDYMEAAKRDPEIAERVKNVIKQIEREAEEKKEKKVIRVAELAREPSKAPKTPKDKAQ